MSVVASRISGHILETSVGDSKDFIYSWNKKQSRDYFLDLKDFAIFFKIKSFREFSRYKEKYQNYQDEYSRIRNWIKTYSKVDISYFDKYEPIPDRMASQFLQAKNNLIVHWMGQIRNLYIFDRFLQYYLDNRDSFEVLRQLNYDILTKDGIKNIDLEFAENFRFKSCKNKFNFFSLKKERRDIIVPQEKNHFIFMIDFRQFEFRTFLDIVDADVDFEEEDLYLHLGNKLNLPNAKIELISYLYSSRQNDSINKVVDKNKITSKLEADIHFEWKQYPVFFEANYEKNKKLHTIIQTISYFIYLQKLSKVFKVMNGYNSKLLFPLHDAMIFSISGKEGALVDEISELLVDDTYKIKRYIGKDLLNLEEI